MFPKTKFTCIRKTNLIHAGIIWIALFQINATAHAEKKAPVPATQEIDVILPGVSSDGIPAVLVESDGDNSKIEIPPTVLVHRYYYTGDRKFQGPYIPGGPSIVVANHPKTKCRVYADVQLLPGAPEVLYSKDMIEYRYGKSRILVSFPHDGGAKVSYKNHLPIGTTFKNATAGTAKATVGLISKTGVPKTTSRVFRTVGGYTYDAGKFVVGKSKQLISNTPLSGLLIKDEAELEYKERNRKLERATEKILKTGGSFPTNQ
ncbi:hypothetical protein Pan241w_20270 [Gimesia alba]|uniref:Uncharacterized protein n=1 Tax=Gimesia alba TaxID=2527973 RepID=A0A517RDI9_9PLAN|nr:hypothetical protein [Gimesia alba]QDT41947.1 hypothetical protein Pan241w_20270 [Gimesia alba]